MIKMKSISEYYNQNLIEQETLIMKLRILLEEASLESLLEIIQSEPTKTMSLKMIDLLHDRNEFLEFLEILLDNKIKEISPIFKVKKKDYHNIGFYVQESIGSLFMIGEYNINTNTYQHNEDFLLEKEKIARRYNGLEKKLNELKNKKESLKTQSIDLTKIELMMKKDQKIKGDIYELDKQINKTESELKNFMFQFKNLYQLYQNIYLYYRVIEELKKLNITVKESLFREENKYKVFLYKEEQENGRRTSIIKKNTDTYHHLIESDIVTPKVFISLENFIRNLPEHIDYVRKDNYIEIEDNFTVYTFYEHGLITIDNIYGNIYDLFDIGIFDVIEKSCNTLTKNESYL